MGGRDRSSFEEFVGARSNALQRFGYLLTSDWALAEDLLQTALARAYQRWSRIRKRQPRDLCAEDHGEYLGVLVAAALAGRGTD